MKKYRVKLTFIAEKFLDVLAESEEKAKEKALEILETTDLLNVDLDELEVEEPCVRALEDDDTEPADPEEIERCIRDALDFVEAWLNDFKKD